MASEDERDSSPPAKIAKPKEVVDKAHKKSIKFPSDYLNDNHPISQIIVPQSYEHVISGKWKNASHLSNESIQISLQNALLRSKQKVANDAKKKDNKMTIQYTKRRTILSKIKSFFSKEKPIFLLPYRSRSLAKIPKFRPNRKIWISPGKPFDFSTWGEELPEGKYTKIEPVHLEFQKILPVSKPIFQHKVYPPFKQALLSKNEEKMRKSDDYTKGEDGRWYYLDIGLSQFFDPKHLSFSKISRFRDRRGSRVSVVPKHRKTNVKSLTVKPQKRVRTKRTSVNIYHVDKTKFEKSYGPGKCQPPYAIFVHSPTTPKMIRSAFGHPGDAA